MEMTYFCDILKVLLERGVSEAELARELHLTRQHLQYLLGKGKTPRKPQKNLKDEQISRLIKVCRQNKLEMASWNAVGKLIDAEIASRRHV